MSVKSWMPMIIYILLHIVYKIKIFVIKNSKTKMLNYRKTLYNSINKLMVQTKHRRKHDMAFNT